MTITALPPAPLPTDNTATFNSKAFALVAALDGFVSETNAVASQVDLDAAAASASEIAASIFASQALASANAANSAANFKGAWSSLTGPIAIPASVSHNSKIWALTESLANIAAETPGVSSKWIGITENLASPSPIGSNTPNAGSFTTLTANEASGPFVRGFFSKENASIAAFSKTGSFTVSTATVIYAEVNGTVKTIASNTAVTMPVSPVSGTDYAIWFKTNGSLEATSNHTSAPETGARRIGGFHYAPGGNATGMSGGNTTPAINEYSFWDLNFRPACQDPRGMTLVANSFWSDIYLLGVDHLTNGTSKYNVLIADGSSPPKIPTKFGGNGSNAYGSLTWWEANEVLRSYAKRSPTYSEFAALAYGTTEASAIGTDQGSTILNAAYTSKWGVIQSSGVMWVWGDEFGGGAAGAGWTANTGGRGSTYQQENAVVFGGGWGNGSTCGSRASNWSDSPSNSSGSFGARGVCDHLILY